MPLTQAAGGRTGAVYQMFNDLRLVFFRRELRERYDCPQNLAYVGYREAGKDSSSSCCTNSGSRWQSLAQSNLVVAINQRATSGQSGMVIPSDVFFSGLKIICADFIFAILDRPFDKIATAYQFSQKLHLGVDKASGKIEAEV